MSFGDKVIEKANEERRRLVREILCFFNLSVVSLLLSLSDRPLQNIGSTPHYFMPTEPSTHLNVDTTTFILEKYVKVPEARYGVGPNFLSLRTWAIFHGIETFCDISELQGIAAIGEGYILI